MRDAPAYVELQVTTNYSFLRGASHPMELFAAARAQGHQALGVCDHGSLAGIVRAHKEAVETGIKLIIGCRVDLRDGSAITLYPTDRDAYARLCTLISLGKKRGGKNGFLLDWEDVAAASAGMLAIFLPQCGDPQTAEFTRDLVRMRDIFGLRASVALTRHWRHRDALRLARIARTARAHKLSCVVTNDVLYHHADRRVMCDVMSALRHHCSVDELGERRQNLAGRQLLPPREMTRLFATYPEALARSVEIAQECRFSLAELSYQYPRESVMPGKTPQQALEYHTWNGARVRYGAVIPDKITAQLKHELELIARLLYAPYFLTVYSIVNYARSQEIMCQGRGSAANSAVCYVLRITAIDPVESALLFERFISAERNEPPDIDVDFDAGRREEVIQWIFETYGRDRAALCATVIRYRARGAMRDAARAMGYAQDTISALTSRMSGWGENMISRQDAQDLGFDPDDSRLQQTLAVAQELMGFPRHLSQHPGGFVLTDAPLHHLVPIEPAAMELRQVIEWDKDDIDYLRFMKMDVLGLGMLGCMARCFALLKTEKGILLDLAGIPANDEATYQMIRIADTIGVFQIESRAQMSMLPRIKPACFYDLVVQVAIVRPGPIQGNMVHPYLRRREGREKVVFPNEALRDVLGRTLGVALFQEQAMKIAMVCAGFSAGEADELRRSMATFKMTGGVGKFRDRLVGGMLNNGYDEEFAKTTITQIEGFGSYGFPESHAASFALLAYASAWLRCHHPDIFCCAILNAQPMGFYAPAQIIRDAQNHGVEILPVCVAASEWECRLEPPALGARFFAMRLGFAMVRGFSEEEAGKIVKARAQRKFRDLEDVWRRAEISRHSLETLNAADAFAGFGLTRRQALWKIRALPQQDLPLFALGERISEPVVALKPLRHAQNLVADYRATGVSLRGHPMEILRMGLAARGVISVEKMLLMRDGARVKLAGLVLLRQRPGSGKGVVFMTLEDESGQANIVVWPAIYEKWRGVVRGARGLVCRGRLQREGLVVHLIAEDFEDISDQLDEMAREAGVGSEFVVPARNFH